LKLGVQEFVEQALQCSVFVSPRSPGLTRDELFEVGERVGFRRGEISDQLRIASSRMERGRYVTESVALGIFAFTFEGDPRDGAAADFVMRELRKLAREVGRNSARLGRDELVAKAVASGHDAHDTEVAIAVLSAISLVRLDGSDVVMAQGWASDPSSSFAKQQSEAHASPRPYFGKLLETVRDVVERRDSNRLKSIEPIKAFGEILGPLGYQEKFGAWWAHTAGEMRRADPTHQPMMVVVLAVALAEGALALICRHAKSTGTTMTKNINVDKPKQWKFTTLVSAAKKGPEEAGRLLDDDLASRCLNLNERRQAIHVGRLLVDYDKHPIPDFRPEDAREAKTVLDLLLRRILDWYESNPVKARDR
jgi:hypothetical protein